MMIDATAMTSADPVDITAIRMRNSIAYSPVVPNSFCATSGADKPATRLHDSCLLFPSAFNSPFDTSSSVSSGAPWALLRPT